MVMTKHLSHDCDAWVLSGGQGTRMGGQDKGLIQVDQNPMAWLVAQCLTPQVHQVRINANRHLPTYQSWPWPVHSDDTDLPTFGGPMVGALTGLRHSQAPWLQLAACDMPYLPIDLTARLHEAATSEQAQVAVPVTKHTNGSVLWHHWTSALVSRHCMTDLHHAIERGERRLGKWLTQQRWVAVLFDDASESALFTNINSPANLP